MGTRATYHLLIILLSVVVSGSSQVNGTERRRERTNVWIPCNTSVLDDADDIHVYWTSNTVPGFTRTEGRNLTFPNVSRVNTGDYVCYEFNSTANTNTTVRLVHLIVEYPVEITNVTLDSHQFNVNDTFHLNFTIAGNPPPSYVVRRVSGNSTSLGGNTSITGMVTFQSSPLRCRDSDKYTLTGFSSLDISRHISKNVTVLCGPTPSEETIYRYTARLWQPVTFAMQSFGYPLPNFTWHRGNETLAGSAPNNVTGYLSVSKRTVANVSMADYGSYTVDIQNEYGKTERTFSLQPTGPPEGVSDLSVGAVTESSATLTWTVGFNYGSPQTFTVYRLDPATGGYTQLSAFADTPGSVRLQQIKRVLDSLESETDYTITIRSSSSGGNSTMSTSVDFKTEGASRSPAAVIVGSIIGGIVGLAVLVFIFYKIVLPLYRKGQSEQGELSIEELPGKGVNQSDKCRASVTMPYRPSVC